MKRSLAIASVAIVLGAVGFSNITVMAAEVSLKLVSMLPKKHPVGRAFKGFIDRTNEEFKGQFRIDWRGGPEVVPQFKQPNAVRIGSVDMTITSPSYANGILSVSGAANYSNKPYEEISGSGYLEYMTTLHKEKNLVYVAELPVSDLRFHIYFRTPIKSITDIKNKKIRVFPAIAPAITALGGSPLVLPMGEIFTAMERGIVDGFAQGTMGVGRQFKGVAKAYLAPGMYRATFHVLANPKSWAKLSSGLRGQITRYARTIGATKFEKSWAKPLKASYAQLADNGINEIRLSPAEEAKYKKLIFDAAWASIEKKAPKVGPKLRSMLMK